MTAKELYDRDFFEWTQCNASLLRAGRFDQADMEHIAEEIEDMGKSQHHEMHSRLRVLIAHLLKWKFQPDMRSTSWTTTIGTQRDELELVLEHAPSLRNSARAALPSIYGKAVREAGRETKLPRTAFPETSPFTLDQILDDDFYPD